MSEVPQKVFAGAVNRCFEADGLPKRIKIDNGKPLANPSERDLPTLTVLWWVGLGIEVIFNKPACPEQNGTVEGLQGIICRWADPKRCDSPEELQRAVDEANRIQRKVYRVPRMKNKTREELYPQLNTNPRRFCPQQFDYLLVEKYLAQKVWLREVKKNGCISFFGVEIYISQKVSYTTVTVTYDPDEHHWIVRNAEATILKNTAKAVPTEADIRLCVNMSMNNTT